MSVSIDGVNGRVLSDLAVIVDIVMGKKKSASVPVEEKRKSRNGLSHAVVV